VPTVGKKEIAQVGATSANTEREIGDLIAEAMETVGKRGRSRSRRPKDWRRTWKRWTGCSSTAATSPPYFVTDPEKMETVLGDWYVLIHDKNVSS
jgi:chaperonin GroEL